MKSWRNYRRKFLCAKSIEYADLMSCLEKLLNNIDIIPNGSGTPPPCRQRFLQKSPHFPRRPRRSLRPLRHPHPPPPRLPSHPVMLQRVRSAFILGTRQLRLLLGQINGKLLSVFKTGLYTGTQGAFYSIVLDAPRGSRIERKVAEQTHWKHK